MVVLGAKNVQSEDDISGFGAKPKPGRYHVQVLSVDESFERTDKLVVEFEVLAGTVPGQEGRTLTEYFAMTEKAVKRLQRLALVLKLLYPGEEKEITFSDAIGRQLVIEVEPNHYEKKNDDGTKTPVETVRVGFLSFWSIGNPAVEDVPLDKEAISLAAAGDGAGVVGRSASSGGGGNGGGGAGETRHQQQQPAAAADKWADI